jgi:hypothetical protein
LVNPGVASAWFDGVPVPVNNEAIPTEDKGDKGTKEEKEKATEEKKEVKKEEKEQVKDKKEVTRSASGHVNCKSIPECKDDPHQVS